jgi:hypothetical protein
MGVETVKDPEKGTDRDVSGAVVRIPVPRTLTYDVGKQMTFASLGIDCGYSILPAAGLALSVVGEDVVITFLPGTTTLANVQAALAADPVAKEMLSLTGTAGTLPVGWAGGVGKLYNDLYAEAVAMLAQDSEGHWVPFSGKSLVVDVKMDAFAAVPDSALSVGTDDGLATGAKKVQKVTAAGTQIAVVGQSSPSALGVDGAPAALTGNRQGFLRDIMTLALLGHQRVLGVNLGAITAVDDTTHIRFSGCTLTGRVKWVYDVITGGAHHVTTVTEPGATPGTLLITPALAAITDPVVIPVLYPAVGEDPSTESKRMQETNPITTQGLPPQVLDDTTAKAAATYYYPSSEGASRGTEKDLSFGAYLQAGAAGGQTATLTLEFSDDPTTDATRPTQWVGCSRSLVQESVNASGFASWVSTAGSILNEVLLYTDFCHRKWRLKLVIAGAAAQVVRVWTGGKAL